MLSAIRHRLFQSRVWQRFGKNRREAEFWRANAGKMVMWYLGEAPFRLPFPSPEIRETRYDLFKNAVLTYIRAETEMASYRTDLALRRDSFAGRRVADIGSGPLPTLNVFDDCERYCIDHLMDTYREIGYPLEEFEPETTFVEAKSEALPFDDGFFDVVVSRNALDHVDDFPATCREIERVLAEDGWLHIQLHYHEPTGAGPQRLHDQLVHECFDIKGLRKVREECGTWGFDNGKTVVWSNVPAPFLADAQAETLV